MTRAAEIRGATAPVLEELIAIAMSSMDSGGGVIDPAKAFTLWPMVHEADKVWLRYRARELLAAVERAEVQGA